MNFFDRLRYLYFTYFEMPTQDKKVEIPHATFPLATFPPENKTSDKYLYFKKFDTKITTPLGDKMYSEVVACKGKDNECVRFVQINNFVSK